MNIAMERRHAVRDFSDRPIDDDTLRALNEAVDAANADGGLDVQLVRSGDARPIMVASRTSAIASPLSAPTTRTRHSWTARSAITASALP